MDNLDEIIERIERYIDAKEQVREEALRISHDITIKCRRSIQFINRGLKDEAVKLLDEVDGSVKELNRITSPHPDILYTGFVENACQEYAEASCLYAIINDRSLPDPDRLMVPYSSYLMGLCDVIGELRRLILDDILKNDYTRVDKYLGYMDRIYEVIMRFDYPSGLIPIKRKQDMARSLIDRTRGDLVVVNSERGIIDKTNEFYALVERIKRERDDHNHKEDDRNGIDVDKIW